MKISLAIKQILRDALIYYHYQFKYEKVTFLFYLILFPFFTTISYYLRGEFVKTVHYLEIEIPFAKFLIISWSLVGVSFAIFDALFRRISNFLREDFLSEDILVPIISAGICALIWELLRVFLVYAPFLILVGLSLKEIFLISILLFVLSIPIFFTSLLISSFSLIIRGRDSRVIRWIVFEIIAILLPISYSIFQIVPKGLHFLLYFYPTCPLFEGIKQLLLLGNFRTFINYLFASLLITVPWTILSLITFNMLFKISRRRGLISLR